MGPTPTLDRGCTACKPWGPSMPTVGTPSFQSRPVRFWHQCHPPMPLINVQSQIGHAAPSTRPTAERTPMMTPFRVPTTATGRGPCQGFNSTLHEQDPRAHLEFEPSHLGSPSCPQIKACTPCRFHPFLCGRMAFSPRRIQQGSIDTAKPSAQAPHFGPPSTSLSD